MLCDAFEQEAFDLHTLHVSGLADGKPLTGEQAAEVVATIVAGAFREFDGARRIAEQAIVERPTRASAYLV